MTSSKRVVILFCCGVMVGVGGCSQGAPQPATGQVDASAHQAPDSSRLAPPDGTAARPPADVAPAVVTIRLRQLTSEREELKIVAVESVGGLSKEGILRQVVYAPDGSRLYGFDSDLGVVTYDSQTFERNGAWEWTGEAPKQMVISADGSTLAIADAGNVVQAWDTKTMTMLAKREHEGDIEALAIAPDGALVISSGFDTTEYVAWEAKTGNIKWKRPTRWRDTKPVDFTPDGQQVVLWGESTLEVCDAATGDARRQLKIQELDGLSFARISPDGAQLLIGSDVRSDGQEWYHLALLTFADLQPVWTIQTHARFCSDLQFSPDGATIALSATSQSIDAPFLQFLHAKDGSQTFALSERNAVERGKISFSPDGLLLANRSGIQFGYRIWSTSPPTE